MTLTRGNAPLAATPADANYALDGPGHYLYFEDHPRRIRAYVGDRVVLDTTRGRLLHETNLLPTLYAPLEDFDDTVLVRTDHSTHCPFKGDASYWDVAGVSNALWAYEDPIAASTWLKGYGALYWDRVDRWLEEDEEVRGHLRDPYHRVDARRSSRRATVTFAGEEVAASDSPLLVFETNLPVRAYLPRDAVAGELVPSETRSFCPYKGEASYWHLRIANRELPDAAWSYEAPYDEAAAIRGLVSFYHDQHADLEVEIAAR